MLYNFSRLLQFIGLLLLPVAISGNLAERLDLKTMLIVAGSGIVVFFIGWLLQQSAKPQ